MANLKSLRQLNPSHQFREPSRQDPYRTQAKPGGMPTCIDCRAVNFKGRWRPYSEVRSKLGKTISKLETKCPACRQLEDRYAMGVVELLGDHWREQKKTVLNVVKNSESIARYRNDQERVLWVEDQSDGKFKIYVTLPELARRIGRELEKTFKGIAEYKHSSEEPYLRVTWQSDSPHVGHEPGAPFLLKRKSKTHGPVKLKNKSRSFRSRSAR